VLRLGGRVAGQMGGTPPRLFPPLGRQRMPKAAKCEPFAFAHLIVRLGFIYLLCIASMFLSVLAVNLIPNDVILKHLRESLPTENYRVLFGATNTDQHTECIAATIGISANNELGLLKRSLLSPRLGKCEKSWRFLKTGTGEGNDYYWRYWHGSQIIMRPALAMVGVLRVRALTLFLFASSFMFCFLVLYRHGLQLPGLAMFAGLFCVPLQSALFILPHAMDWIIGFLACGWVVMRLKRSELISVSEISCTFFFIGVMSAFFGLLNNPLVSLTIPLFGLFWAASFRNNNEMIRLKLIAVGACLWLIGYAASWSTKWLLAGLFVDQVFTEILEVVNYRLSGSASGEMNPVNAVNVTWYNSVVKVLVETKAALIFVFACLILNLLPIIRFVKAIKPKWSDLMSFLFICLLPFVWFAALRNHTIVHAWFVSAVLYTSFAMILSLILLSWAGLSTSDFRRRGTPDAVGRDAA
jgi:hypothetical protein